MNRRSRLIAGLAGASIALAVSATVLAYAGQAAGAITVTGPSGTLTCDTPRTVTATVVDASSNPIEGQPVAWSFTSSPASADTINSTPTTTNASGAATTVITLACVAGNRTVTAIADDIRASAVLSLTTAGLPRTSTAAAATVVELLPIATIVALIALLVGGGIIARRSAVRPR